MKLNKKFLCAVLAGSVICASSAFAAESDPVVKIGSQTINAGEFVQLLTQTAGGNPMLAGLMLSQSTLQDKIDMARRMADSFVFAEGAKAAGIADRDDIAFRLKWQYVQTLLEAYLQELSTKWDMSEKAMKKYYNSHKSEFVQAEAANVRHILVADEKTAEEVLTALQAGDDFAQVAEKYSRDPNTAKNGGALGWIEKGAVAGELAQFIESAEIGKISSPMKTQIGFDLVEVTERRPSKQLSYKEAGEEVPQRLQMKYVNDELEALKKKYPVEINEQILDGIGKKKDGKEK